MKRFLRRLSFLLLLFAGLHLLLVLAIPADRNQYLNAFNQKLQLLIDTPSPRIIFMGGSNTAFGIDSRMVEDSLGLPVVNYGLHGGIGLRFPMTEALPYLRAGDIVVLQAEYANFFEETCNAETMPKLMAATRWRFASHLSAAEWKAVLAGMPMLALSHLKRLLLCPFRKGFDTPVPKDHFAYTAAGFNVYGDEVSHLRFPGSYMASSYKESRPVREEFIGWLRDVLHDMEQRGITLVMLPPACVDSYFKGHYSDDIANELQTIGYPYVTLPQSMTLPDSFAFDSGYHLNAQGVEMNTRRIIEILIYERMKQKHLSHPCFFFFHPTFLDFPYGFFCSFEKKQYLCGRFSR